MAFKYFDRVSEVSSTTGTGAISLGGASNAFRTFASVYVNGDTMYYCITDAVGNNWEVGSGTYNTSGNTLTRNSVAASSNAGALVNFSTGSIIVFTVVSAAQFAGSTGSTSGTGSLVLSTSATLTSPTISGATITGSTITGHASLDLLASNNLSDVVSASSARSNIGLVIGTDVQAWDADLQAIAAIGSAGFAVRTAANTWTTRLINGTAAEISVANPGGLAGDVTLSLPTLLTFTGKTITGGTYASAALTSPTMTTPTLGIATATQLTTGTIVLTGSSTPANGFNLPSANTVGVTANSSLVGSFTATGMNNTVIGATTPLAGNFTTTSSSSSGATTSNTAGFFSTGYTGTGTPSQYGVRASAFANNASVADGTIVGGDFSPLFNVAGTLDSVIGVSSNTNINSSAIVPFGVYGFTYTPSIGTSTIGTHYGYNVANIGHAGTTTSYGFYAAAQSGSTTNYAYYYNSTVPWYVDINGFTKDAGRSRVATQFDKTTDNTLTNVTGLTATVVAAGIYSFRASLSVTAGAGGGMQVAIGGTCTATNISYTGWNYNGTTVNAVTTTTTKGNAVGAATAITTNIIIEGTLLVNAAGTLTVQMGQNVSNGTTSSVLVNSNFTVQRIS